MRKREKFIGLWLSDAEYRHLLKQCTLCGLNTSALLRHIIMDVDIRQSRPTPMPFYCGSCPLLATM